MPAVVFRIPHPVRGKFYVPDGADSRSAPRTNVRLTGQLSFPGTRIVTPCVVLNMSSTGALVRLANAGDVASAGMTFTDKMRLLVYRGHLSFGCESVRRVENQIGLCFLSIPSARDVEALMSSCVARSS